jgi:hypothetical protein
MIVDVASPFAADHQTGGKGPGLVRQIPNRAHPDARLNTSRRTAASMVSRFR